MSMREPVTRQVLSAAVEFSTVMLGAAIDADWSVKAGYLEWDCRTTLDHIADALGIYAGRLATLASGPQHKFRNGDASAEPADLIVAVQIGAALLSAATIAAPADGCAWHRMGTADLEGCLAMGCEEVLGHSYDIAPGLGIDFAVPDEIAGPVVDRLFPWAPVDCSPWEALLWCSNPIVLPGKGTIGNWGWWSAPLGEWPGGDSSPNVWPSGF
jgi:hypothetical protein